MVDCLLIALACGGGTYLWQPARLNWSLTQPTRGRRSKRCTLRAPSNHGTPPVASKVMGRLTAVLAGRRHAVRAGQVLAKMEAGDLQSTVDEAQARERLAQAQFAHAGVGSATLLAPVELDRVRADLEAAQAAVKRNSLGAMC